jgi:hypothetical protein
MSNQTAKRAAEQPVEPDTNTTAHRPAITLGSSPLLELQPLELNNTLSYCSVEDLNELGRTCR